MKIPELIKNKRRQLNESQKEFGKRFNSANSTVSLWENGMREAPYKVIEFVIPDLQVERPELTQNIIYGQYGEIALGLKDLAKSVIYLADVIKIHQG